MLQNEIEIHVLFETLQKTLLQTGPSGQHSVLLQPLQSLLGHESARVLRFIPAQESGLVEDLKDLQRRGQKAHFREENAESRHFRRDDEQFEETNAAKIITLHYKTKYIFYTRCEIIIEAIQKQTNLSPRTKKVCNTFDWRDYSPMNFCCSSTATHLDVQNGSIHYLCNA